MLVWWEGVSGLSEVKSLKKFPRFRGQLMTHTCRLKIHYFIITNSCLERLWGFQPTTKHIPFRFSNEIIIRQYLVMNNSPYYAIHPYRFWIIVININKVWREPSIPTYLCNILHYKENNLMFWKLSKFLLIYLLYKEEQQIKFQTNVNLISKRTVFYTPPIKTN